MAKAALPLGALALSAYITSGMACKGATTPEPPPKVKVNLSFEVYNHTRGKIADFQKLGVESGSSVSISIGSLPGSMTVTNTVHMNEMQGYNDGFMGALADPAGHTSQTAQYGLETMIVQNVSGVDQQRIAIRQDNFGNLVTFNNTGTANFTAPNQDTNYDIILFNAMNNAPYQWMDDQNSKLGQGTYNLVVYRQDRDGVTGPESNWTSVWDQYNQALNLGWVRWGSITVKPAPNDGTGNIRYGYAICIQAGIRGDGEHGQNYAYVDVDWASDPVGSTSIGLSEAFECMCRLDNIGGQPSSMTIQYQGVLNGKGKDLIAYVFAKDSASKTSSSGARLSLGLR